jgi:hypothetical protein
LSRGAGASDILSSPLHAKHDGQTQTAKHGVNAAGLTGIVRRAIIEPLSLRATLGPLRDGELLHGEWMPKRQVHSKQ